MYEKLFSKLIHIYIYMNVSGKRCINVFNTYSCMSNLVPEFFFFFFCPQVLSTLISWFVYAPVVTSLH